MGEPLIFRPDPTSLEEHPAVRAWRELGWETSTPTAIDVVTTPSGKRSWKSAVYRLYGVGPQAAPVIAKRAGAATMRVERLIYQEVLPALPAPALRCYGFVVEQQADACWLFLEDAGGVSYCEEDVTHRHLAAEWLGVIQGGTGRRTDLASYLPHFGSERYLAYLRQARATIREHIGNPALHQGDLPALWALIAQCDAIEERWCEIEAFCAVMPRCLVHGDFIAKNVRVRSEETGLALYVLDWEAAGWGIPAEDLGGLDHTLADFGGSDIAIYRSRVREVWPHLDQEMVGQLVTIGTLFRYLAWTQATSFGLAYEWVEQTVETLKVYAHSLWQVRRMAGLGSGTRTGGTRVARVGHK